MRTHVFASLATLFTVAAFVACSSDSEDGGGGSLNGPPHGQGGGTQMGDSSVVGSGGSGLNGSTGGTGAYGSAGAGPAYGGSGGTANEPGKDAGSDADAAACEGLDPSKPIAFFLSSDDSNSMASPVIARRLLNDGHQVPPYILRTYEFLNYYNVGLPPAPKGTLTIVPELRLSEDEPGSYELGIGVAAPAAQHPRRPIVLTLVLDRSGSMAGEPIALERAAVTALAGQLQAGDIVNAVEWNTQNAVMLDSYAVKGPSDPVLIGLADKLKSGGGTNLNGGLSAGYMLAQKNFDSARLNRVVLISDGQANAGITDQDIIGKGALQNDGEGIYLVGVGVGEGVNDTLMNVVPDAGRGAYVYLDSEQEAQNMFGTRFDEVMDVAARGVQVELRVPWYMGIAKFYGEEYSTNPEEIEPQHLAPDDAMFFDQIVKPCSDSHFSASDPIEVIARWQMPVTHQPEEVSLATTFEELLAKTPAYLPKAAAIIAYAEALKNPGSAHVELTEAKALVAAANPSGTDPELNEIAVLIGKALSIYK